MDTPVKRPPLSNQALHSTLPLDSFETPDSQSSGYSDFNFDFSGASTPRDRHASLTPITPLSSFASQPPSSPPQADPFEESEDEPRQVNGRPIWPLRQSKNIASNRSGKTSGREDPFGEDEVEPRQVKTEQDDDESCSEALNSRPILPLRQPKNLVPHVSERTSGQEDYTFKVELKDVDWSAVFQMPSESSQNVQHETASASERRTTAVELVRANSPTSLSATVATSETVTKSEVKDSVAAQQTELVAKDVELSASTTHFEEHAKIALNAFKIDLFRILPHQIRERYHSASDRCCASLVKDQYSRCTLHLAGSQRDLDSELSSLSLSEPLSDVPETLRLVQSVVGSSYLCRRHQNIAVDLLKKLATELADVRISSLPDGGDREPGKERQNRDLQTFRLWIKTLSGDYASMEEVQTKSVLLSASDKDGTGNTSNHSISISKTSVKSYIQTFVPYHPKQFTCYNTSELLLTKLLRPLFNDELKSGSIYMFWFVGNFGHIKIGATARNTKTRKVEWERCCEHDAGDLPMGKLFDDVPHALRVEKLIQAELRQNRKSVECRISKKKHREWFEVEEQDAVAAIKKWVEWIKSKPYEEDSGPGDKKQWRLKAGTLAQMMERVTSGSIPQSIHSDKACE